MLETQNPPSKPATRSLQKPSSVSKQPDSYGDRDQKASWTALAELTRSELPAKAVKRQPAGLIYSVHFFRALLLAAIVLMLLTMIREPQEPDRLEPDPEISTGEISSRDELNSRNVDGPPPAILVQPSE